MIHDDDDDADKKKRTQHVLDDPGFVNSFKIRKQVGRSKLRARAPIIVFELLAPTGWSQRPSPARFPNSQPGPCTPSLLITCLAAPTRRNSDAAGRRTDRCSISNRPRPNTRPPLSTLNGCRGPDRNSGRFSRKLPPLRWGGHPRREFLCINDL